MSLKDKSLQVLTPMYDAGCKSNFFESFTKLSLTCNGIYPLPNGGRIRIPFNYTVTYNESLISRARNRLVDEYLKRGDFTHAVFIDADIGFNPLDILTMLEFDKDILAAPCSRKSIQWERLQRTIRKVGRDLTEPELARLAGSFIFNQEEFQGNRQMDLAGPVEVLTMGSGLMMIRRNVFEQMKEAHKAEDTRWYNSKSDPNALPGPIFDFFRVGVNPQTHEYNSEDYCFCEDARALGFHVFMAPWMATTHMGTVPFIADMAAVAALTGEL